MRIISGYLRGRKINPPKGLPVRPTTDMAKEALFNVLTNRFHFEKIRVLDLFTGTGSIALEFISRGVDNLVAVDQNNRCIGFLNEMADKFKLTNLRVVRDNVFKFIGRKHEAFDIIFADPPYDMAKLEEMPKMILESGLLKEHGYFILEHPSYMDFENEAYFMEKRKYGQTAFSFFQAP
ncbi:16S rRNA (guanine(966)-N(2))-methyltransferase RsmD [Albibacterium indicum]|uniref:16S rRNA (guanine(966)-N(2))-methyltransferase RsmD n=1 Tax=Albibacterium indicum TaxID=2292082 RepID=UPI000E4EB3E6|nr:16S rRNA (guanine(966)-N(2))-methyltransferase RsmD [Pedobacter indicus]